MSSVRLLLPFLACLSSWMGVEPAAGQGPSQGDPMPPTDDRLVDVGGYRLGITCSGSGSPTVILEAGLGSNGGAWSRVAADVATFARVCSYDRPNLGRSDAAPRDLRRVDGNVYIALRSGAEVVRDLHTLLDAASERGPYVLVGHSLGGLFSILYASRYPDAVVGMVLVDAAHPDQIARSRAHMTEDEARRDAEGLAQNREGLDVELVLEEARATRWRTEMPLLVLTHGRALSSLREERDWLEMQLDHSRRSSTGRLIIAQESGSDIHIDQAGVVAGAIREVVTRARSAGARVAERRPLR